jgi:hypothetical protein
LLILVGKEEDGRSESSQHHSLAIAVLQKKKMHANLFLFFFFFFIPKVENVVNYRFRIKTQEF